MIPPIKVMIVDDHLVLRQAFQSLFEEYPQINVIDDAENGKELLEKLEYQTPDVILLDLEMPIIDGYDAAKLIRKKHPKIKIIILSTYYSQSLVAHFIQIGASGAMPKDCAKEELIEVIEKAILHEDFFGVSNNDNMRASGCWKKDPGLIENNLSEREIEILDLICREKSNKQISQMLDISEYTVEFHRKNIYKKSDCQSLIGLYKFALKMGIT